MFDDEIKDLGYDYDSIMEHAHAHKPIHIGNSDYFVTQIDNVVKCENNLSGGYTTYHLDRMQGNKRNNSLKKGK